MFGLGDLLQVVGLRLCGAIARDSVMVSALRKLKLLQRGGHSIFVDKAEVTLLFLLGHWRIASNYVFEVKLVFSQMLSDSHSLVVFGLKKARLTAEA